MSDLDPSASGRSPSTGHQDVRHVARDEYLTTIKGLADEGYDMCIDLTAVDYLEFPGRAHPDDAEPAQRFEVVVNLLDMGNRRRVRLRVQVPEDEPVLPTLFDVYPGSEAMEREVFDMFGLEFTDHPDLTRILMPEDWVGHPLRKDDEIGRIPVQFKGANT